MDTSLLHPEDKKIFDLYPAPLWQAWMEMHPGHINATLPFYGTMLYFVIRALGACTVVEIGVAQGYSSFFMASAIKDNNIRYQMNGQYIAIDIQDKTALFNELGFKDLPIKFIQTESVKWLETQTLIEKNRLDLVFVDGWHETDYVKREIELLYPLLKDKGDGYMAMHDIYAWCEEVYPMIIDNPDYKWESIRFLNNYGFALLRKMENYDKKKIYWPDGCQKKEKGFVW